jgi:hypothetical protein
MIRRRGFIGSILGGTGACFFGVKRSSAKAGALRPPPLAMSAGFSNLIFDEEFDRTPNIGFGTDGHEWKGGYVNSVWCTLHKNSSGDSCRTIRIIPRSGRTSVNRLHRIRYFFA